MGRGCLTRVGTRPHHSRAEPRAPRAPAPPTTAAPQRASCDRTRGCAAGAVAALPVHRSLVAARRVSARAADARGRGASRRQVDVDARDAPPRQLRRLPRIRRALHSGASRTHRARARESTRRRRSRRAHARARTTHLRKPSLAARAPRVARSAEADLDRTAALARMAHADGEGRSRAHAGRKRLAQADRRQQVRPRLDLARFSNRPSRNSRCGPSATSAGGSCSTFREGRFRLPRSRRRCASCLCGTAPCSRTRTAREFFPRSTGRR